MKIFVRVMLTLIALYVMLKFVPADNAPHAEVLKGDLFEIMAHGAGQGHAPKNTIEAALIAYEMGATYIEMDVHRTIDDIFVTIHDATIDATTDGNGGVRSMTIDELQSYDAGYGFKTGEGKRPFVDKGIMIPALEAVFGALPDAKFVLEIKPDDASFAEPFCQLLRKHNLEQKTIVASFHKQSLNAFRTACPEVPTSISPEEVTQFVLLQKLGLANLASLKGSALHVPIEVSGITIVTSSFVQAAHDRGLEVHVWTVNDPATISWLYEIGVDGVMTDFPDRAHESVLNSM